jgi:hypothetical protein
MKQVLTIPQLPQLR